MRVRNYQLNNPDGGELSRVAEPFAGDLSPEPARRTLTVSELTRQLKELFEQTFAYSVYVEGELSDPKIYPSGHLWFDLKDSQSTLKCVMWKESVRAMKFQPEQGLQVICSGRVEFYAPRGEVKFSVRSIEPKGMGALQLAFEQLKEKLQKEGLFSEERKRPLPAFPQRVGLVTSPQGAAIDDMLRILRGEVEVLLKPSRVQGNGAAEAIARGIEELNDRDGLDLLIVGRGGGSLEDLWAFNEEVVARSIFHSRLPVISAVGHEKDWSIADLVADLRAPTPTKGAEMVLSQRRLCLDRLAAVLEEPAFTEPKEWLVERDTHRLQLLQGDLLACSPQAFLRHQSERLHGLRGTLNTSIQHLLRETTDRVHGLAGQLHALSPLSVLDRGYSITFDEQGRILKKASQVKPGDRLRTRLHQGHLRSRVEEIEGE
ncbi:MAG: exodeoxyribonuclease VII large subunit [Candidatus Omnitrophota bacterium]|nr:exodeoxyribonuclease VII large subunit [Candidatus Omnitrophota bacterium]